MGYANDEYVVPAILMNNPGITRDEFSNLLFRTNIRGREYDGRHRWDLKNTPDYDWMSGEHFHERLKGVADILHLEYSDDYRKIQNSLKIKDEFGITYNVPYVNVETATQRGQWMEPRFVVEKDLPPVKTEKTVFGHFYSEEDLCEGMLYDRHNFSGRSFAYIERYVTCFKKSGHTYHVMKLRKIDSVTEKVVYPNLDALLSVHPQFDPKTMFDWSPEEGVLFPDFPGQGGVIRFRWKRKGEKYYLDHEFMMNNISWYLFNSYTSLMLTSEAVKNNAWKLLSYRGYKHTEQFFRDFPDAVDVQQKAVWDTHSSMFAKHRSMSVNEFLRFRLTGLDNALANSTQGF